MKTKDEWKQYFGREYFTHSVFGTVVNGKKHKVSYFFKYADEEHKKDKELNALNFEKTGSLFEIAPGLIDFEFVKQVYNIKKSLKVLHLPYEWKNNPEEKQFLEQILINNSERKKYDSNFEMNWWFEPGFWSDTQYTDKIKKHDYYHLNLSIIKDLNYSTKEDETNCLLDLVNHKPSYLKHLTAKNKKLLPLETVLNYAKEHGLKSLAKVHKDTYEVVKAAFHSKNIGYQHINDKFKTPELLVDLLNHKEIWRSYTNEGHTIMDLNLLPPELLSNKDIMKSCMSDGYNLLVLRKMENELFFDKDLKKIALQTHTDYKMIEDCLDDSEVVLAFISNIKSKGIELFEQTKRIDESAFKDKEVMTKYVSLKALDNDMYIAQGAKKALESFSIDELIEFVKTNKEIYKALPETLQSKWELVLPFYELNRGASNKMPSDILDIIQATISGFDFQKNLTALSKFSLEEKLSRTLDQKEHTKKIKI